MTSNNLVKLDSLKIRKGYIDYFVNRLDRDSIGTYRDIKTVDELCDKILSANYVIADYSKDGKKIVYRTNDIGYGYIKRVSIYSMERMLDEGRLPRSTELTFEYRYCNIFPYVEVSDISILLTNTTYIVVEDNTLVFLFIGCVSNPNRLYYRKDLDGVTGTIDELIHGVVKLRSVEFRKTIDTVWL